jgi:hypothetical protein
LLLNKLVLKAKLLARFVIDGLFLHINFLLHTAFDQSVHG